MKSLLGAGWSHVAKRGPLARRQHGSGTRLLIASKRLPSAPEAPEPWEHTQPRQKPEG